MVVDVGQYQRGRQCEIGNDARCATGDHSAAREMVERLARDDSAVREGMCSQKRQRSAGNDSAIARESRDDSARINHAEDDCEMRQREKQGTRVVSYEYW
jgi:hypothetical protein